MATNSAILMLCENFYPLSTASAQRAFAYARTLTSHSLDAVVVTKSFVRSDSRNMTIVSVRSKGNIPIFHPMLMILYCLTSARIIRQRQVGLILATVPKINNAAAGLILSKLFRIPLIIDIRDYWESSLLSYPLSQVIPRGLALLIIRITSLIYRNASSLITVNETMKSILVKRGITPDKILLVPNGADTSLFKPCEDEKCVRTLREKYSLPLSKVIFIYGGALSLDYKFDALLRGINRLQNDNLLFLIVGSPTLLMTNEKILGIVQKLGLEKKVKIFGPLPVEELAGLLRCCDVGVIPLDDNELLTHVITAKIFAYLASGLPVLASGPRSGELKSFIDEHEVGFFIEKASSTDFAQGLQRFLRNRSRMKQMGRKAREVMMKYYDRYTLSQKILGVTTQTKKAS